MNTNNQIRLLIIGYVWPEPKSSAAGSRMLQLIEFFLQQQWQVTFASAAAESEHRYPFENIGVKKKEIEVNDESFDCFIKALRPDIVLFDRFLMEEQFGWRVEKFCPDAVRMIETVDLHCLREARYQAHKRQRPFVENDLNNDIAVREIASILRSDLSIIISPYEMNILMHQFNVPDSILIHIPFMLETISDKTTDQYPEFQQRQHFISIGNYRHAPNWDAVIYLKEALWPRIQKRIPQAELHVYGSYPPKKATQMHNPKNNFYIKGWANSAEEVIKNARVCLAPLRFGAGLKGKLLDAMQYGTPSITTSIGAEGMHQSLEWNGTVTDVEDDYINAAVDLYSNEHQWIKAQQNGYNIINTEFCKASHAQKLLKRITYIQNNLETHRGNNFIGKMLRHHTMKSTQYMAQWIEEKNKNK